MEITFANSIFTGSVAILTGCITHKVTIFVKKLQIQHETDHAARSRRLKLLEDVAVDTSRILATILNWIQTLETSFENRENDRYIAELKDVITKTIYVRGILMLLGTVQAVNRCNLVVQEIDKQVRHLIKHGKQSDKKVLLDSLHNIVTKEHPEPRFIVDLLDNLIRDVQSSYKEIEGFSLFAKKKDPTKPWTATE